jgi:hypothetical protein
MESNITEEKLSSLIDARKGLHVSLYMPTHETGTEVRQDITRFKNCLNRAEYQLVSRGLRPVDSRNMLEQAARLADDGSFWHHLDRGLALFVSENHFEIMRLPITFQEMVVAGDRFYIKPILRLFNENERYYLLSLSENVCRLFLGTRDGLTQISIRGMPASMDEALRLDDPERQLHYHTETDAMFGDRPALYHGHGGGKDNALEYNYRYLRMIDRAISDQPSMKNAPLIFAGLESLYSLFRKITGSPFLLDQFVAGNTEVLRPHELHQRAWPLIERHTQERAYNALSSFREYAGTDIASSDLRLILKNAFQGRVETIFISDREHVWGRYTQNHDKVVLHSDRQNGDEELIDRAAVYTLVRGGSVYVFEESALIGSPVAALFRY